MSKSALILPAALIVALAAAWPAWAGPADPGGPGGNVEAHGAWVVYWVSENSPAAHPAPPPPPGWRGRPGDGRGNGPDGPGGPNGPEGMIMRGRPDGPMPANRSAAPYGDFCPQCSKYGRGRMPVELEESMGALRDYFSHRAMSIDNVHVRGPLMRADVFRDGRMVDRVIFDRRSGRVRSIY